MNLASWRHQLRPAAEAAVLGWLAVLFNDWHESLYTRPKGTMYSMVLIGSLPALVLGVVLAVRARTHVVDDVRECLVRDGELPPPHRVIALGVKRGLFAAVMNLFAYLGFFASHPARMVTSFFFAGVVGGAWLGRSVVMREYPVRAGRPSALFVSVLPAAMLAVLSASAVLITTRMSLDNAVLWAFDLVPQCGGVEIANASLKLLPITLVLIVVLACSILGARRLMDGMGELASRRFVRVGLSIAFVAIATVAFAELTERVLLASPPGACRNTPYRTPLQAILHLKPASYLSRVLWWSGALGGALSSLLLLVASRRSSTTTEQPSKRELGPYR